MYRQQHPIPHRKANRAGVYAAQNRRPTAACAALGGPGCVCRWDWRRRAHSAGARHQAPENHHIVVRGVVVVRRQVRVEQVGDMQAHQRVAAQRLQRVLDGFELLLKLFAGASQPQKPLGGRPPAAPVV